MKSVKKFLVATLAIGLIIPTFTANAASDKLLLSIDGKKVQVKHLEKKRVFSDNALTAIVNEASKAVKDEKDKDIQSKKAAGTYNFISGGDDYIYVYEEAQNADPILVIADQDIPTTNSTVTHVGQVPLAQGSGIKPFSVGTNFITDGIGGKQNVTLTNATYMSALMQLPTSADEGSWNYGGFDYNSGTATYSGEMGLQYYSNLGTLNTSKGWKPVLTFVKTVGGTRTSYNKSFDPSYSQVQYKNGYVQGASINYYSYYNYNGYVRMKMTGTALCANLNCDSPTPTTLTTIMQTDQTLNFSTIDNYKLISSIVTTASTGNNRAIFSEIKVGTTSVPSANFSTPLVDNATITRNSSNTVTIDCD